MCVCMCLLDGMGCVFTGLQSRAGWRPAETVGLENGVCLCVPLLRQRETRQLSPITPPLLHLSHTLTSSLSCLFPFSFHIPFISSLIIFSCNSSHLLSWCFLTFLLSLCVCIEFISHPLPSCFLVVLWVPSFHTTNFLPFHDKQSVRQIGPSALDIEMKKWSRNWQML